MSNSPDAIKTWANAVTVARVLIAPILFVMITGDDGSWPAFVLWIALCVLFVILTFGIGILIAWLPAAIVGLWFVYRIVRG